ncbi:MAG TPA: S8 family peptidase, partial [Gillisia sp.]|nr:S8 family peptidase [Gillisia sp.]
MKNLKLLNAINLLMVMIILILFTSCSEDVLEQIEEVKVETETNLKDIIPGRYIVIVSHEPAVKNQKAAKALEELTGEINKMAGARVNMKYSQSLTGFSARLTDKQVALLKKDKRVKAVHQDKFVYLEGTATQEYPSWGLDRLDQREGLLDRAYSYNATGAGVNAYIMDSGIRYSHQDFGERASLGIDLVQQYPDEEIDQNNGELEAGNDCNGHGTHVAGTVGGTRYGVAKNVNLISVRVFSCVGRTTWSRLIMAVDWITENAVEPAVVNMSIGGMAEEAMDIAIENSIATGIHYVLAAGNNNSDACNFSPARTAGALTVGASTISNEKARFSNYGECLDVYAPGENIVSAFIEDDTSSRSFSGTSMAAPHVAGLAALYLEKNPNSSPANLHEEIINNSTSGIIKEVPSGNNNLAHSLWEPVEFTAPTPPDLNLKVIGIKGKGSNKIYLVWEPTEDPFVTIY